MNSRLIAGMLSGVMLLAMSSCNKIERRQDVGTTAAVATDSEALETTQLAALEVPPQEDTVINPSAAVQNPEETITETEVVRIDTVSTRIVYDVRRRMIEEVDTVGATKTYEIKKTVLKRTVMLDTLTQTEDEEQTVTFQKGDFKKLDEKVETDTVVEVIDYQSSQQRTAPTPPTQSPPITQPAQNSSVSTPPNPTRTEGAARGNAVQQPGNQSPSPNQPQQAPDTQVRDTSVPADSDREQPDGSSTTESTVKRDTTGSGS